MIYFRVHLSQFLQKALYSLSIVTLCQTSLFSSTSSSPIASVPDEVMVHIFSYLPPKDRCRASGTCKQFNRIANDSVFELENRVARVPTVEAQLSTPLRTIFRTEGKQPEEEALTSALELIDTYFSSAEHILDFMTKALPLTDFIRNALDPAYFSLVRYTQENPMATTIEQKAQGLRLIPPCVFKNLPHLRHLNLSLNTLIVIPEAIRNLSLESLNLSLNRLTIIPEAIGNLIDLKYLDLSYNNLIAIPEAIGSLTQLRSLLLSGNKLKSLPSSIGNLVQLKELQLDENQLKELPVSIGSLTRLKALDLSDNLLTMKSFPESFRDLSALKKLSLNDNKLKSLPSSIKTLFLRHSLTDFEPKSLKYDF